MESDLNAKVRSIPDLSKFQANTQNVLAVDGAALTVCFDCVVGTSTKDTIVSILK